MTGPQSFEQARAEATAILAQIGEHSEAMNDLRVQLAVMKGFMAAFRTTEAAAASSADSQD